MSFLIAVESIAHLFGIRFLTFIFNHLFNIPLSLLLGFGKYVAFAIAVVIDIVQMVIYYNVLNNTRLGRRFGWSINKKLFNNYRQPGIISRFHRGWVYVGVGFLSLLPIYFGGMFASVFTAHLLRLNRMKSYVFIGLGSIVGCYIWTVGLWSAVGWVIVAFRHTV